MSDGELTSTDDLTITVMANGGTTDPVANAGLDQTVYKLSANLSAIGARDGGGLGTSTWSKISGPGTATFGNASGWETPVTFSAYGTYVLRFTQPAGALSTSDELTINIEPPENQAPVAQAGEDQIVPYPGNGSVSGSVNDDSLPIGSSVTTLWTKESGPGTVTFGNASLLSTTASYSLPGDYVLRLTASDGALDGYDELLVTVLAPDGNDAPAVSAGSNQTITLPVNTVTLQGTMTDDGEEPGAPTPSSTWSKVSGPALLIDNPYSLTTQLTVSTAGTYVLRLTGTDGELSSTSDVTITVLPQTGALQIAINCGGSAYTATDGTQYTADQYYHASSYTHNVSNTIAGTSEQPLYKTFRLGSNDLSYAIPVPNGSYSLKLRFMEYLKTAAGQRIFGIGIEGTTVQTGVDIWAAVGQYAAYDRNLAVTVSDGTLNITFPQQAPWERPVLCGIELRQQFTSQSFDLWKNGFAWNGQDNSPEADPENDGWSNILEYARGTSPVAAEDGAAPEPVIEEDMLCLTYERYTTQSDVIYQAEASIDLLDWFHVPSIRQGPAGAVETWKASVPLSTGAKFIRLKVVYEEILP